MPCCLSLFIAVSFPSYPGCRNVCSGLGGWVVVVEVLVERERTQAKIRAQWPVVIPGQRFLCLHSWTSDNRGLSHCPESPGSQSVPRNPIASKSSPCYRRLSQTPVGSQRLNFCVTGKKGLLYNFTSSIHLFLSKSGGMRFR